MRALDTVRVAMVMAAMLNASLRTPKFQDDRYPFRQNLVVGRCYPSVTGFDGGAEPSWQRAVFVGRGRGFLAFGAAASGGRRRHSGGVASLAQIALCTGDAGRNPREPAYHSRASV